MIPGAHVAVVGGERAARERIAAALAARGVVAVEVEERPDVVLALDLRSCAKQAEHKPAGGPPVIAIVEAGVGAGYVEALMVAGADDVVVLPGDPAALALVVEQRVRAASELSGNRAAHRCADELAAVAGVAAERTEQWPALDEILASTALALGAARVFVVSTQDPPWIAEPRAGGPAGPHSIDLAEVPEALAATAGASFVVLGDASVPSVPGGADPALDGRAAQLAVAGISGAIAVPLRAAGQTVGALVSHHRTRVALAEPQSAFLAAVAALIARIWATTAVVQEVPEDTDHHTRRVPRPRADSNRWLTGRVLPEQTRLESELKKTTEFLEKLIESTVDAIIVADVEGTIILFNPGAVRLFNRRAEEVIGQVHVDQLYPPGVSRQVMRMLRSPSYGGVGRLELTRREIVTRSGDLVPVNMTASVIYEGVREVATVGVLSDLRDRIRIEQRLLQAQEKLLVTERQALVAELAGTAAHELNQPLTSVLLAAEMLARKSAEDDPQRRAAEAIRDEVARMAEIVKKIGRITQYETKQYVGGANILDLDKAVGKGE
jgi:PAS domain S-box-containing protein